MNKTFVCAYLVLFLYPLTTIGYGEKFLCMFSRPALYCEGSANAYDPISQEAHVFEYAQDQVAYFAVKGDPLLADSGEIARNENELFFYGFSAPTQELARYIQKHLHTTLKDLENIPRHDYTDDLAQAMENLLVSFYNDHSNTQEGTSAYDPCNVASQDVLISFLHLIDNRANAYVLRCVNGKFERINHNNAYVKLKSEQINENRCIAMQTTMESPDQLSPIYTLANENAITRKALLNTPAQLVRRIIETDQNEHIKGMTFLNVQRWLEQCKCPATTPEYSSLELKWNKVRAGDKITGSTDAEKQILQYASNPNRRALLLLATQLRMNGVSEAVATFLDDKIEECKEEPSLFEQVSDLFN